MLAEDLGDERWKWDVDVASLEKDNLTAEKDKLTCATYGWYVAYEIMVKINNNY